MSNYILEFVESLTIEMVFYMIVAFVGLIGGTKLFRRLKEDISPREFILWAVWVGMLIVIIVSTFNDSKPMPAIRGVWSLLTGILVARFLVEDKTQEMIEDIKRMHETSKSLAEKVESTMSEAKSSLESVKKKDAQLTSVIEEIRSRSNNAKN